jgi:hypothetical protein
MIDPSDQGTTTTTTKPPTTNTKGKTKKSTDNNDQKISKTQLINFLKAYKLKNLKRNNSYIKPIKDLDVNDKAWKFLSSMPQIGAGGYAAYMSPYSGHGNLYMPDTKFYNK